MRTILVLFALLFVSGAMAEPAASTDPSPPSAEPATSASAATPASTTKREACRTSIAAQKLPAPARSDAMLICLAEGRLECTKAMVAAHTPPAQRKDYLRDCIGQAVRR